jgi:WD40 repeat protein
LAVAAAVAWSAPAAPEEKDPRSADEVRRAKDDLSALRALADDPTADPNELWKAWPAFRARNAGTPEWRQAAEVMANAPSPLDRLDGDQISAAGRSPETPKEVAAVLGGNRGMHRGAVGYVAVTGDGRTVVSGCYRVHFWNPDTLSERMALDAAGSGPMAFFPDGKAMVTCGKDPRDNTLIRVWDLSGEEPKVRAVLPGHGMFSIEGLALAADHKTLFTVEPEGESGTPKYIRAWDVGSEKPKELSPLKIDKEGIDRPCVTFILLCARRSMTLVDVGGTYKAPVRVWNLDKDPPQIRCYVKVGHDLQDPGPLAIAPDGKTLASEHIQDRDAVVLWDVSGPEAKGIDRLETGRFWTLAFLPSGDVLAVVDRNKVLQLWPLNDAGRKELGLKEGQKFASFLLGFEPTRMAFTDDGKTVVIGGEDHLIHIWDLDKGKERFPPSGHRGGVGALAFSPDGKTLATCGAEGGVRLWDLTGARGQELAALEAHTNAVHGLAFAPDGKTLASVSLGWGTMVDKAVRLWDLSRDKPRRKAAWEPHAFGTHSLAFSPAGGLLVTAGTDGTAPGGDKWRAGVRLWDLSQDPPAERAALDFQDRDDRGKPVALQGADHVAFDARGKALGFLTGQQALRLYDLTADGLKAGPVLRPFSRALVLQP